MKKSFKFLKKKDSIHFLLQKSVEDELQMREYLKEGDLVSAEVQQCFYDGSLSLHTRSLRYGKLGQGQRILQTFFLLKIRKNPFLVIRVPSFLVRRRKAHIHNLPFGVSVILGCNGFIWIAPLVSNEEAGQTGGYVANFETMHGETREVRFFG